MTSSERPPPAWPLFVLGGILLVTVGWWSLALWPLPGEADLLARARAVCFDTGESGLPGVAGWMLLVGQPLSMVALLTFVSGPELRAGLARLGRSRGGRGAVLVSALLLLVGLTAAGARVGSVLEAREVGLPDVGLPPDAYPRLDRSPPPNVLVDHRGESFSVDELRGRPFLVTFAFGHCEAICPLVVENTRRARDRMAEGGLQPAEERMPLVVITLDPWRDVPSQLPHLADRWGLESEDRMLGGAVESVEAALDAWRIPRSRDLRTGEVTHPPLVYVVDRHGRIAFASNADPRTLEALIERLERE